VPNVQWKTPDDGQRNCPKHVKFLDKNKFGKISVSVGFIIRKYNKQFFSIFHLPPLILRHKRRFKKEISVINDEKRNRSPKCKSTIYGIPTIHGLSWRNIIKNNPETDNMRLASQGQGITVWEFH
jgi:hypothetical protein